jgi:hypothetical protein
MTGPRRKTPSPLFVKFIADCQERITQQMQMIAGLKQQGLSTSGAEIDLKKQEAALRELQNHAVVMRFLLEP